MGKENVELRVHMYHEPVGTRVTRVNEVCGVDPAGWSAERGSARGKFLPGWKRSLTWRQPFSPETGETVDQVTGRPFPGRYWSIAMISDPRIPAIAFGNVTWKMVLRCRWVGGDEKNERDARRDRRLGFQPQDG